MGPECAPNVRARVVYRPTSHFDKTAFQDEAGFKTDVVSVWHDLDNYFDECPFISEWPARGTVNTTTQRESPYDLYLVSIKPIVILGIEKGDPNGNRLDRFSGEPPQAVGSKHLFGFVPALTTLPYRAGARVVWLSPAVDHAMHPLDPTSGTALITIGKQARITVEAVGDAELVTSRK